MILAGELVVQLLPHQHAGVGTQQLLRPEPDTGENADGAGDQTALLDEQQRGAVVCAASGSRLVAHQCEAVLGLHVHPPLEVGALPRQARAGLVLSNSRHSTQTEGTNKRAVSVCLLVQLRRGRKRPTHCWETGAADRLATIAAAAATAAAAMSAGAARGRADESLSEEESEEESLSEASEEGEAGERTRR